MENFVFQNKTRVIFGKDTENRVGLEVARYSNRVLLCYGSGSIKKTGLYDTILESLEENGIRYIELSGIKSNPRLAHVNEGIELCRKNEIEFILAVGGGSVIDTAKAIAVGIGYNGNVWDFFTGKARVTKTVPVGVVLTFPGTGSETSKSSVITNEDGLYKYALNSEIIRPVFSIMNPEITYTLPPYLSACGVVDAMSHIIERYFTNVYHVDLTDRLCEATLKTLINNARVIIKEPENYNARAEIMLASTIAHNDLLGMGRIEDWASHKIEHEISALYDVHHGAGLAIILPAWMKYVSKYGIRKFVQFAVKVWDVDISFDCYDSIVVEGINRTIKFFKEIGLPVRLEDVGISDERLEEMANKCTDFGQKTVGNLFKLKREDVLNILNLAL